MHVINAQEKRFDFSGLSFEHQFCFSIGDFIMARTGSCRTHSCERNKAPEASSLAGVIHLL